MSHFTCMIILPQEPEDHPHLNSMLTELLAPFDENIQVDPYRNYHDKPESGWRDHQEMFNKFKQLINNGMQRSDAWKEIYGDAEMIKGKLGYPYAGAYEDGIDPEDDAAVVAWANTKYESTDEERMFLDENGIYEMSTYNPKSQWDWWQLGGRWLGYFQVKTSTEKAFIGSGGLMTAMPEITETSWPADCVRKDDIDIDGMLLNAASRRAGDYDEAEKRYPNDDKLRGYTYDIRPGESRDDYIVRGLDPARLLCPYSVLAEGVWRDPGKMGWWGASEETSSSRQKYNDWFDRFWVSMPGDTWLAVCDLHI